MIFKDCILQCFSIVGTLYVTTIEATESDDNRNHSKSCLKTL